MVLLNSEYKVNMMNSKNISNGYFTTPENISITKARNMLTKLPERLAEEYRAIALTRRGNPVMALMSWDLYEAIAGTLEIMEAPDLMAALRRSIKEATEGKVITWESVKSELDLSPINEATGLD